MPTDQTRRFLLENIDIRGAWVRLDSAWQSLTAGRNYPPPVADLLGEMAAVSVLLAANLKHAGRLTLQIHGNGPVTLLVVDCDEQLRLRGMAHHADAVAPATVLELLGHGQLALTLDAVALKQPYQSLVPLQGDSLAAIFEHYLTQSEQQPTRLIIKAHADRVVGLFLQALPGATDKDPDAWQRVNLIADTLKGDELLATEVADLLPRLFPEDDIRLYDPRTVTHHCPKDWEKIHTMLRSLGQAECEASLKEHGEVLVHDDLCGHDYRLDAAAIAALFAASFATLRP
jgi:molecular chaperone Hsp33